MQERWFRNSVIALFIVATAWWSLSTARAQDQQEAATVAYSNARFLATPEWLAEHREEVTVVDVRTDEYFDGTVIPGAIRMPWSLFRTDDKGRNVASTFVGVSAAEAILGKHGIARHSTVVIYDSVKRDGGATASYVFWVLDVLGHESKRVLNGGIDAWKASGGEIAKSAQERPAVTYKAPAGEIARWRLIAGDFVHGRLGDPHYQILDVRSAEEYRGKKGTKGIQDNPLKLGHIPGAVNREYTRAWIDKKQKTLKSAAALKQLYAGLDTNKTVIVYCNSGRRGSFSYFVLRLLGHPRVLLYEPSWKEWGEPSNHYPVELKEHAMPAASGGEWKSSSAPEPSTDASAAMTPASPSPASGGGEPAGGYVSCGG